MTLNLLLKILNYSERIKQKCSEASFEDQINRAADEGREKDRTRV